ncbi:MAG: hypothetical protein KBA61_10690 [Spirochaetes bacterium]|nr:hypothetical protein [Spirochaetota bacterium]
MKTRTRRIVIAGGIVIALAALNAELKAKGPGRPLAIVNGSAATALGVDDYIFFRPTQSEGIMREFGDIVAVRGGRCAGRWPAFPQ